MFTHTDCKSACTDCGGGGWEELHLATSVSVDGNHLTTIGFLCYTIFVGTKVLILRKTKDDSYHANR